MPKEGFKNQWVEICRIGEFIDAGGKRVKVDDDFLNAAIANFNAEEHEAPICIGHPNMDAPAYGWTENLRRNGDRLEARFSDTNDEFEKMVEQGLYRKRSTAFYLEPVRVKHVGFLGAMPPAVKGLKNIRFAEGETVAFENSINLQEIKMEEKDLDQMPESFWATIKAKLGLDRKVNLGEGEEKQTAQFSEADKQGLIAEAVKQANEAAEARFAEELGKRDKQIQFLTSSVNATSASGIRAAIVNFVEGIPAENGRHFLKNIGVVEFLEECAKADAERGDKAEFVAFSEGDGDSKTEHKFTMLNWAKDFLSALPPMVAFGEKFGSITATAAASELVDPTRQEKINTELGLNKDGGDK